MGSTSFNCAHQEMVERVVEVAGERNHENFMVKVPGLLCSECGFATISNKQSGVFTEAVSDAYRRAHGLLTGDDLRALRARNNMTQLQFAEYLGVGPASVKRWEHGQIQDKAMDALVRLKTDPAIALRNARDLNRHGQMEAEDIVYRPQPKISLDISGLYESEVFVEIGEAMAG